MTPLFLSTTRTNLAPVAKGGDSGSLIIDRIGRFVTLLTCGTDDSDIAYATPFEWIWELMCEEFPGASLLFEDFVT